MRKRCAGLFVIMVLLLTFGRANAEIEFAGVIDPHLIVTRIDSVSLTPPDTSILTPGWFAEHEVLDTFTFSSVTAWPETLRLYGTMNGFPVVGRLSHPKPDTWYRLSAVIPETPFVMFYGDYGVEESKPAVPPLPRLTVSPSVVTGQMTVRLQSVGTSRPIVEIHDAVGNVVRSLDCATEADGVATATWNCEDESGRLVPEGVYFCRYATSDVIAVRKVLVAR